VERVTGIEPAWPAWKVIPAAPPLTWAARTWGVERLRDRDDSLPSRVGRPIGHVAGTLSGSGGPRVRITAAAASGHRPLWALPSGEEVCASLTSRRGRARSSLLGDRSLTSTAEQRS